MWDKNNEKNIAAAAGSGCTFPYLGVLLLEAGGLERSLVGMMGVLVRIWTLELLGQQLAETLGHRVFAAAQSQTIHLCLCVWLQS